jgi:hypothetical protein
VSPTTLASVAVTPTTPMINSVPQTAPGGVTPTLHCDLIGEGPFAQYKCSTY